MLVLKFGTYITWDHSECGVIDDVVSVTEYNGSVQYHYGVKDHITGKKSIVRDEQIKNVKVYQNDSAFTWMSYKVLSNMKSGMAIGPDTRLSLTEYCELCKRYREYLNGGIISERKPRYRSYYDMKPSGILSGGRYIKLPQDMPVPKKVLRNGPATIIFWMDGTKTIVKKTEEDSDDPEKAIMYGIFKKMFSKKLYMKRYLNLFKNREVKRDEEKEADECELHWKKQRASADGSEGSV